MGMLRSMVIGLVVIVAVALGIGLLLPRHVHVERAVEIDAPPSAVFGYLDNYERFNEWSPWARLDPNTQYTFSGPQEGVGAAMAWVSDNPNVGAGSQEITEVVPDRLVRTALDFGENGTATAFFRLDALDGGTRTQVTWGFDTDLGYNPITRYVGLMFDSMIGADYEQGLAGLKTLVESET